MRRYICSMCMILCCALLAAGAGAQTYRDDMTGPTGSRWRTCTYLRTHPLSGTAAWSGLPERTALTPASAGNPTGWLDYEVSGAGKITVGLLSKTGTFVKQEPGGEWVMGVYGGDAAGAGAPRAQYSPSHGAVYALSGGVFRKAHAAQGGYVFRQTTDAPSDLREYGAAVHVSSNGVQFRQLALSVEKATYVGAAALCHEELTATLPAGTRYLRVELCDVTRFPLLDRPGEYEMRTANFVALTSVTLEGDSLVFGSEVPPPAAASSHLVRQESSAASRASAGRSAGGQAAGGGAAVSTSTAAGYASSRPVSAASAPGTKFTGVIEAPPVSRKSGGTSLPVETPSKVAAASAPGSSYQYTQENTVYRIIGGQPSRSDDYSAIILIYIFLVIGAILTILVKKRK